DLFIKNLRQILSTILQEVIGVRDDADTRDVTIERDIPEPATTARFCAQHERGTAIQIRFAMRAFKVRVEHPLLQFRIANAPAKLVREHRHLASRIDNHFGVELLTRAVLHLHFDTHSAIAFKEHLLHEHALMHNRPLFGSMIDQQMIELRARDLPGDGAFVMDSLEEIKRARLFACRIRKLDTVLPNEWTLSQFFEYSKTLKGPIRVSHQRLTDMMSRKNFFLEKNYPPALARQHSSHGTPCGSTTHYNDVKSIIGIHA